MDGGGRLVRSLRSLRPQADLKAAACGAVALLREWLGLTRVRARAPLEREPPHRLLAPLERHLPHRTGVTAALLLLLRSRRLGGVEGGQLEQLTSTLSDTRNAVANSAGFRITSVAITGRKQLTQDEVLGIGGVNGRASRLL